MSPSNSSSCYTDLPVVKRSYASSEGVCGKSEYLKPVGEFTSNFLAGCTGLTGAAGLYVFQNAKFRSNVPHNQIVTFYVDIRFGSDNGSVPSLFGGNHFTNVPIYANVGYGYDLAGFGIPPSDPAYYSLHLVYNPALNLTIGDDSLFRNIALAKLFVKKGTQIYAGIH